MIKNHLGLGYFSSIIFLGLVTCRFNANVGRMTRAANWMVVCLQSCKCCILLPSTSRHCNLVTAVTDFVAGKFDEGFVTLYLLHSYRASKLIKIEPVQLFVATWVIKIQKMDLPLLVRNGFQWYQTNNNKPLHIFIFLGLVTCRLNATVGRVTHSANWMVVCLQSCSAASYFPALVVTAIL